MNPLRGLEASVRSALDEPFRTGETDSVNVVDHAVNLQLGRDVDVEPLVAMINEAVRRFRTNPEESDAWLAPRVHATIRLSRREAADRRIWNYLNVFVKPDYVRWRWIKNGDTDATPVPVDRFLGDDRKSSVGRLWWAAELTRNGSDYSTTASILKSSRFIDRWQILDVMHHRPAAIAVCRFNESFNDGKGLTNAQSERLSQAFNLRVTTLALDALAHNPEDDMIAIQDWCGESVDETKYVDQLPQGPDEEAIPEASIQAVFAMLETLADEINLSEVRGRSRKAESEDAVEEVVATATE